MAEESVGLSSVTSDPGTAAASEARLRVLIEVAPDGIFVTRDGVILYVNAAGVRMLGAEHARDVISTKLSEVLSPHELEAGTTRLASVEDARLLPVRVYDVRGRGGKVVTVEATSLAIEWEGAPAALTFGRDITERLRLEAALSRADRLAALGVLAAGVAHEINNPLAFVSLGLDELERRMAAMPDAARSDAVALIGELRGGIQRVATITRDLRTFAHDREEAPAGSADLAAVIATVGRLVAHQLKHRAKLVVDVPPDLPPVRVATARLEQVLVNLFVNAAQALEGGDGVITIRAQAHPDERILVEVNDNGSGIPPAILARLFEPFFTTKAATSGTGLGLAISQSIITDAGGDISVESEPGRGTTFRIMLPIAHERPVPLVEPARRGVPRGKILIVDDEPGIVGSLSSLLSIKHDVEILTSARSALATLRTGATYDVILCDLMMPDVTGMDLHEQLARARPGEEAKLVFMTGGAFTDRARAFLTSVSNRCLEKPFKIQEVEDLLAALLDHAP